MCIGKRVNSYYILVKEARQLDKVAADIECFDQPEVLGSL